MFAMTSFEVGIYVIIACIIVAWMMKLFVKGFMRGLPIGIKLFLRGW